MKIWFIARTEDKEYLYIKINSFTSTQVVMGVNDIAKMNIYRVPNSEMELFVGKNPNQIYLARVGVHGMRYVFTEDKEIEVRESKFYTFEILKSLPHINAGMEKTEIIMACHEEWKKRG